MPVFGKAKEVVIDVRHTVGNRERLSSEGVVVTNSGFADHDPDIVVEERFFGAVFNPPVREVMQSLECPRVGTVGRLVGEESCAVSAVGQIDFGKGWRPGMVAAPSRCPGFIAGCVGRWKLFGKELRHVEAEVADADVGKVLFDLLSWGSDDDGVAVSVGHIKWLENKTG